MNLGMAGVYAAEIGRTPAWRCREEGERPVGIISAPTDHSRRLDAMHREWEAEQAAEEAKADAAVRARVAGIIARRRAKQPKPESVWHILEKRMNQAEARFARALREGDMFEHPEVVVTVVGEITDDSMRRAAEQLCRRPNARAARLVINSTGGDYVAALGLAALLMQFKMNGGVIQATVLRKCRSAALSLFAIATDRAASERATFHAHRTNDELDQLEEAIVLKAGMDGAAFHRLRDADATFDWEEAVASGLVNSATRLPKVPARAVPEAGAQPRMPALDPAAEAWAEELAAASGVPLVEVEAMLRDGQVR